ncbi:Signal recognition particle SEC65 subunit [Escovopsis weberi]|uniref:Signal recognition particle SEC65 subunit n=1 Tax=Escovopsis weberi TaxID=150374 RepID=A0A0M8N055_ESCWE|nr:Signal recognition particle SEC65 subunit [Escovopsis weberi]
MSHPRIEEVSDSDPDAISDPEEVDLDDFDEADIMRRIPDLVSASAAASSSSSRPAAGIPPAHAGLPPPYSAAAAAAAAQTQTLPAAGDRSAYSAFQCIYPVYFDASRTRAEGRRVSAALAVRNPLAREIANACSRLRLPTLLEPEKIHPKDWANPGRVKVGLKQTAAAAKNKHHLYVLIARHLRDNPTTEDSAGLRLRIGGQVQPPEGKPYPRPAVPRGWKMGELLPYLSAAMTGGGVSENLFKDMMREMQAGGDPMAALMAGQVGGGGGGGGGAGGDVSGEEGGKTKKKKDKKGKGRA